MKRKKGISDIVTITLTLFTVACIYDKPILDAILYGVIYGAIFVSLSRFTKGISDKIILSFTLALFAFFLFYYAFEDMKKAAAITGGLFLLRLSVAVLPGPIYEYFTKIENILCTAKKESFEVIRQKSDE